MSAKLTEQEQQNREAYLTTYTGLHFHPFDPRPEEISIIDIAKGLRCQPRFGGHTIKPYYVGDHSVLLTKIFLKQGRIDLAKHALLHDSAEAYLLDLPHPVKYMPEMIKYKTLEKQAQRRIYERFGLDPDEPKEVKELDSLLVNNEKRDLRPHLPLPKNTEFYPDLTIIPWGSEKTEREFLKMFNELFGEEFGEVEIP